MTSKRPHLIARIRTAWVCRLLFAVCFLAGGSHGGLRCLFAQPDDARSVTIVDVEGNIHRGVPALLSDSKLTTTGPRPLTFNTSEVLIIKTGRKKLRAELKGSVVFLENGDRLVARPTSLNPDKMTAQWVHFPKMPPFEIRLETVRGFIVQIPETARARGAISKSLIAHRETSDFLILKNGDRLAGELTAIEGPSLTLRTTIGRTVVELDAIRAVGMNTELISFPEESGNRCLITLIDGSRLTCRRLSLKKGDRLELEALFGAKLLLPLSSIVSIRFLGGRAVYLSDLEPADYKFTPYLSARWSLKRNLNVLGGPLRLRGEEYARGLGMHSQSAVTYQLGGRYRRFLATPGIDDAAGGDGSVQFTVEVDGKRVFTSGTITGRMPAVPLKPIDVTGKQKLTLWVEFGEFGDIRDYANWCDAVLVK